MKSLSRVVWSEGMYVAPHHFQAQSRYVEDSLQFAATALWFKPYGFSALQLDDEALTNGIVSVIRARGVFPDGLAFDMPDSDPLPEPLQIGDRLNALRDSDMAALAIPARSDSGENVALENSSGGASARYLAAERLILDETSGRDEKPVRVGRKNVRLTLAGEDPPPSKLVTLPLARVRRSGSRRFVYDPLYAPPCLDISASPRLLNLLERLQGILEEKSAALLPYDARDERGLADQYRRDLMLFWYLHTIHSSLGALQHQISKRGHPEPVFQELLRLGGAVCSFSLDTHPRQLPAYDHDDLSQCFGELDEHIRHHLELMAPTRAVSIALRPARNYYYIGEVPDPRLLEGSRWILGVHSSAGEAATIRLAPQRIVVCSFRFVERLVGQGLTDQGLSLKHLNPLPAAVPEKQDFQYFSLSKEGRCWEHIRQTKEVGVYVPDDLPSPQLELIVLMD